MRVAIGVALLALAACGGKNKSTTPDKGTGGEDPPLPVARTLLGWGTAGYNPDAQVPKTKVFLEITDHNGATQSYPMGEIAAPCSPVPGNGADIVTVLQCNKDGTGAEFRAVYRGSDIIILRRWVTPEDDPAEIEMAFQEISRVPVPTGSKVAPAV
jgi:hypothetical protein